MTVGLVGLGKMGKNLAQNMLRNKIDVIGYDVNVPKFDPNKDIKMKMASSIEELVTSLETPRIVWLMVPSGGVTKETIRKLSTLLDKDDIVVDGGNSFYKDSVANHSFLSEKGISFFDCGTSGGVEGALYGGNFMIGGDEDKFSRLDPIFEKVSVKDGYLYTGKPGSGHYLKMIHNGVEYGMMQAIGEGFEILEKGPYDYNNEHVAKLWNNGSVIRSWLMELAMESFAESPRLDNITGLMQSSGEGKWTVQEALDLQVSVPIITTSLLMRYRSLEDDTFAGKVVSSLRNGFGGHAVEEIE